MPDLTPWIRVKARYEAGDGVPLGVRRMAEEALGEKFSKPMKPARRPDFRDRSAGDDSFNGGADEMVVL